MTNLIRSAKSASNWSNHELLAYNIFIQHQNALDFFGRELGPIDRFDPILLASTDPADPTISPDFSKEAYHFLDYLDLASGADAGQESAIVDLARSVLEVTGFDEPGKALCTRYNIPFVICGDAHIAAQTDVCLVQTNLMILLVVEVDKNLSNPEPQVIAKAIATFQHNNRKRVGLRLPTFDIMTIPCITMVGTRPFFYKVPVTMQLSNCVANGQYPSRPTVVSR
ncbi:hypothetical protein JOM56_014977 [Amanita muscaria]